MGVFCKVIKFDNKNLYSSVIEYRFFEFYFKDDVSLSTAGFM